jgi:hypothetical protein
MATTRPAKAGPYKRRAEGTTTVHLKVDTTLEDPLKVDTREGGYHDYVRASRSTCDASSGDVGFT